MPLSGHDPARDADDLTNPAAAEPRSAVPRGRFGVAEFPVDANLAAAAERALPTRQRLQPDETPDDRGRRPPLLWMGVAVVMALVVGAAAAFVLVGGDPQTRASEPPEPPTVPPTTTVDFDITVPPNETVASTTSEPWVPEEPDPDLIVYDSPASIEPSKDLVEFRDASTVETLVLANTGGGAANWVLSVQQGSGLDVSPAEGQLKPGESVEVRILLDRANGRPLSDWAEDITMIGGGSTRPTGVRVKIFSL